MKCVSKKIGKNENFGIGGKVSTLLSKSGVVNVCQSSDGTVQAILRTDPKSHDKFFLDNKRAIV